MHLSVLKPNLMDPGFDLSCPGVQTQLQKLKHRRALVLFLDSGAHRGLLRGPGMPGLNEKLPPAGD